MVKKVPVVHRSGQKDSKILLKTSVKYILYTILFLIVISGIIIYYITTSFDPNQATNQIFYSLYLFIVLFITGLLSLFLYWVKIKIINKNIIRQYLTSSIRQAFLISAALVILLILYTFRVLSYWDAVPIILAFFFLELFFQSEKMSLIK